MVKALEPIDLTRLPPDIQAAFEARRAARLGAERMAADDKEVVTRLEHLVKELHQALYGKTSEKLSEDERQLAFEDLEVTVAEAEEQQSRRKQDAPHKTTASAIWVTCPRTCRASRPSSNWTAPFSPVVVTRWSGFTDRQVIARNHRKVAKTAQSGLISCPPNCG